MGTETRDSVALPTYPARHFAGPVASLKRARVRALTAAVEAANGVNLGQGSNLLPTPPPLIEAAYRAMQSGFNVYSVQEGILELRQQIARLLRTDCGIDADPESEVRVTSGATGAFYSACRALLEPGSEAVVLEPYYPYHIVNLLMTGCTVRYARLDPPDWKLDVAVIDRACTSATRVLVLCNPCNPSCRVYTKDELDRLVDLCVERNLVVLCDEVYGTLTYGDRRHISIASLSNARERVVTISSFSKSHAITGWRLGYMHAAEDLIERITLVHDGLFVCAPRPLQHAMAEVLSANAADPSEMRKAFEWRRDLLAGALTTAGFRPLPVEGAFYMMASYRERYGDIGSGEACMKLLQENRIATVPVTTFYHDGFDPHLLRFCYALPESEIERAIALLQNPNAQRKADTMAST